MTENVSIFLAYLTPNKVKETIKSILARTFNFRHISDIPHQAIMFSILPPHFDVWCLYSDFIGTAVSDTICVSNSDLVATAGEIGDFIMI